MKVAILDPAVLSRLLGLRGVKAACPFCDSTSWDIPEHEHASSDGAIIPWRHVEGGMYSSGIGAIVMVCTNCGFIRLHDMRLYQEAITIKEIEDD